METEWHNDYIEEHRDVLDRLSVEREPIYLDDGRKDPSYQRCRFTETPVRGFQLMDVFLHELGHHHDRMTTKSRINASRGENYAEEYALKYSEPIWNAYLDIFEP